MSSHHRPTLLGLCLAALVGFAWSQPIPADDEIPITTSSEEARELFLKGRDLAENLRATDAHDFFAKALEKDPSFALAHLGMANTAESNSEFFESLERAVRAAQKATAGERHLILARNAFVHGKRDEQARHLVALLEAHPKDARAHAAVGGMHYGRQEYEKAIEHYKRATALRPEFAAAYNMLGYACRSAGDREGAESAFQRYIQLIPDEPNPYDSYAEFLMAEGRFEESIAQYQEALKKNDKFIGSYIGIGNNQIFMGQPEKARKTFADLRAIARNPGEERTAALWTAASYVHEGKTKEAVKAVKARLAIAEKLADGSAQAEDHQLMGNILLEAGVPDKALEQFGKAQQCVQYASVPAAQKELASRTQIYQNARVAMAQGNLDAATQKIAKFAEMIGEQGLAFEKRRHHELQGLLALHKGDTAQAVQHLRQANQENPRILFLLAKACHKLGDEDAARAACEKAAHHNGLDFNYAYVRKPALEMLDEVGAVEAGSRR